MPDQAKINFYPFSDGAALHRVGTHKIWVLNRSSAVLWCLYEELGEGDSLVRAYAEHFRLSVQQARGDVEQALDQFGRIGADGEGVRGKGGEDRVSGTRYAVRGTGESVTRDQRPVTCDQLLVTRNQDLKTGDQFLKEIIYRFYCRITS